MKGLFFLILSLILLVPQSVKKEGLQGDFDISILSFNLRYDNPADGENQWQNRKKACIAMLNTFQPSVFGIQEGLNNQVYYLDEHLPDYRYVGVGRNDGHTEGEYAAIFYHAHSFELLEEGRFWLSETPETPSRGWDANNIRMVTWVKLHHRKKDKTIYVFNTHFDHMGVVSQRESSELLVRKIREIADPDVPLFITGDFNMVITCDRLEPITRCYPNTQQFAEISDDHLSFNGFGLGVSRKNIDFIFYKHAKALVHKTIVEDYGVPYIADHYPVLSYFRF